ncbi:MAG: sugar transferase, partial [Rhodococcus sp.]|nr:sugar transferase [Rhodococcus sp. (in: high G+C Gram-positive bacteria)]
MFTVFDIPLSQTPAVSRPAEDDNGPLTQRQDWQAAYRRRLWITDTLVVVGAVGIAQAVRFGDDDVLVASRQVTALNYTWISVLLAVGWLAALGVFRAGSMSMAGSGPEEYRRILTASIRLFGVIAIVSLLLQVDFARLYLAIAFPAGVIGLLLSRWCWRKVIARRRQNGQFQTAVLAVGAESAVRELAESFERGNADGYRVVGVCTPGRTGARGEAIRTAKRDIPILGDESNVIAALEFCSADTVAVTATEKLGHDGMRELAWALEPYDVDLVVAPGVIDVAGPRLTMRPVAGLPLLHVEKPRYHSAQQFQKTAFDIVFALAALIVISPVMLATALAVKCTSRGPVFYKAERMGLEGRPF